MEGFTYHNIFDTKGIEYIFILIFFAVLIPFWLILHRKSKKLALVSEAFSISPDDLRIPQGVFFGRNHTWLYMLKNGKARIGLDDMLMHATGLVNIKLTAESGSLIKKGDLLAELEQGGKKLQIFSPISGEIKKAHSSLSKHPESLNNQPFTEGWMFEIKPDAWKTETNPLLLADKASRWMKDELLRFKDSVMNTTATGDAQNSRVVLQDGGELMDHTLQKLPLSFWDDFQDNFLGLSEKTK